MATLQAKVAKLADPAGGIFGPYLSTDLGVSPNVAVGLESETPKQANPSRAYSTANRLLTKSTLGDGVGYSHAQQMGELLVLDS